MAIKPRRTVPQREQRWGSPAAPFAAGVATTLLLLWLHERHGFALSVVPGQMDDGSGGSWEAAARADTWTVRAIGKTVAEAADTASTAAAAAAANSAAQAKQSSVEEQELLSVGEQQQQQQQQQNAQEQQQQEQQHDGQALLSLVPLPNLDSLPHLFISFGNAAYFELAHNWAKSVQAIGAEYIIAALDADMMERCAAVGLVCEKIEFGGGAEFRFDFAAFRAMGAFKVRYALSILEQHPSLPLIFVSDTDTVWLRPPWDYLEQRPGAEFFVSSDCLSHHVEEEWRDDHGQPRCGHVPGLNDGRAFNTGMFAARNTPAARAVLKAWADMLTDPTKEKAGDPEHRQIDDQLALNELLEAGGLPVADEPRTVLAYEGSLRLQTLPVVLFANGHVAFVQQTPWRLGGAPIVIHTTFQRHFLPGKKARLREFHLWNMDPPHYYGQQGGANLSLLAYQNDVLSFVAEAEARKYGSQGRRMPLLEKHWVGMSYQLAAFRDALAASLMLGRTLLFPRLWCWCDNDEHPFILKRCLIKGTDYETPFECPLDFMIVPNILEQFSWPYRHARFLEHPQVPATLRNSRAVVRIGASKPEPAFPNPRSTVGHAVDVWPGIRRGELLQAVQPVADLAVLELHGRVPGFLGGWDAGQASEAAAFDENFSEILVEAKWCCMAWGDWEYADLPYARPEPLGGIWSPWREPQMELPAWCDLVGKKHGNRDFTFLPQHPCAFLRNSTAADLAADDSGQYNSREQDR